MALAEPSTLRCEPALYNLPRFRWLAQAGKLVMMADGFCCCQGWLI